MSQYGSAGDEDERTNSVSISGSAFDATTIDGSQQPPGVDRQDALSPTYSNASHAVDSRSRSVTSKKTRKRIRAKRRLRRCHGSKEEKDRDIKGRINLQFAVITSDDSDGMRFSIDVGYDVYHCKAESQEERDSWVEILSKSNAYFKGLITNAAARGDARLQSGPTIASNEGGTKSEESDESVLEDDGLREAEVSRKALIGELRHVVDFWRNRWLNNSGTISVTTEAELMNTVKEAFCAESDRNQCRNDESSVRDLSLIHI